VYPQDLDNQVVTLGADAEPARDVLIRSFTGLQWSDVRNTAGILEFSWQLLYGPDPDDQTYALSILPVMVEEPTPIGITRKVPVLQRR
jgi:hypothetical protein